MNRQSLLVAMQAAERFLAEANKMLADEFQDEKSIWLIVGTKNSGQVRRSSMDLTRNLADMRRPG